MSSRPVKVTGFGRILRIRLRQRIAVDGSVVSEVRIARLAEADQQQRAQRCVNAVVAQANGTGVIGVESDALVQRSLALASMRPYGKAVYTYGDYEVA
jgi:hypothetical protein